ncbi:S-layer homology domain-containing protein [Priestia taiwanensis]|uniref:SLH domain-containing protein n=1 Tax=Priestia taiwanensis TaxID=1347902 RepID=A0A917ANI9_9BACI|nr:S-layer homology domain-containing protein [Priestia taiwanensis]MBM7362426.1 hypothetical protein [Priestia taiwanensis]GGE62139.1 hypothetical protein GCM10007140_10500 [Priestia taiwanensis]
MNKNLFLSFSIFILLLSNSLGVIHAEQKNQKNNIAFVDVPKDHPSYKEIMFMVEKDIIQGHENGHFGAKDNLSREHLALFLYNYLKPKNRVENPFVDIDSNSYKDQILSMTALGVFSADSEKKFNPKSIVTRAELAKALVKLFNFKSSDNYEFIDMKDHWANEYVKTLYSNGIVSKTKNNKFNPNGPVTREQFSIFFSKAIQKIEKGSEQSESEKPTSSPSINQKVLNTPPKQAVSDKKASSPERIHILTKFDLYEAEGFFMSKKVASNLNPQWVDIIKRSETDSNWLLIKSHLGEKWVYYNPKPEHINIPINYDLYESNDFHYEKVASNLTPQSVKVLARDPFNKHWMLIDSHLGQKWVYYNPELKPIHVKYDFDTYETTNLIGEKSATFAPQTVKTVAKYEDNWYQIETGKGRKWLYYTGEPKEIAIKSSFDTYEKPMTFMQTKLLSFAPQTVTVYAKYDNNWLLIQTSKGKQWAYYNPTPEKVYIPISFDLYEEASIYSKKVASNLTPQPVSVIKKGDLFDENWILIESSLGRYWIYYNPELKPITLTNTFEVYDTPDFTRPKVGTYDPQTVRPFIKSGEFWYQIETAQGKKWIHYNPTPEKMYISTSFNSYEKMSRKSRVTGTYNPQTVTVIEKLNTFWYLIKTEQGNQFIYLDNYKPGEVPQWIIDLEEAMDDLIVLDFNIYFDFNMDLTELEKWLADSDKWLADLDKMNANLDKMNVAITKNMKKAKEHFNAINWRNNSTLIEKLSEGMKDLDFSGIVPKGSSNRQQNDQALYNTMLLMPILGNGMALAELISGKTLTGKDLDSTEYLIAALSVVGGGGIKTLGTVTKAQKFSSKQVDLSWAKKYQDNFSAYEITGTVKVGKEIRDVSRRVYRLEDIDWKYVAPKNVNPTGKSNLEIALLGNAPYTKDNQKIELHHLTQKEPGAMVEMSEKIHGDLYDALHIIKPGDSFRNDPALEKQYNNFRSNYWKLRAKEANGGK